MLQMNTVHVQRETSLVKHMAGFVAHEHVNIHILLSLLWDYVHTVICEKCLVRIEVCYYRGFVQASTHLCVLHTSNCIKKSLGQFFFLCDVVRLGVMVHVSGGRGLYGVSERGGKI